MSNTKLVEVMGLTKRELQAQIGQRVLTARKNQKLTQTDVGAAAGVSKAFVSQVEKGTICPSIATLAAIAEALHHPINYFLTQDDAAPKLVLSSIAKKVGIEPEQAAELLRRLARTMR